MSKFIVEPHFRLQEWVAEEKGYFRLEGLDTRIPRAEFARRTAHITRQVGKSGAFQSIAKGRESNVTCACHWTVNVAASKGHTKLYADAYSDSPGRELRPVRLGDQDAGRPCGSADLSGVPVWQPLLHHPGA